MPALAAHWQRTTFGLPGFAGGDAAVAGQAVGLGPGPGAGPGAGVGGMGSRDPEMPEVAMGKALSFTEHVPLSWNVQTRQRGARVLKQWSQHAAAEGWCDTL